MTEEAYTKGYYCGKNAVFHRTAHIGAMSPAEQIFRLTDRSVVHTGKRRERALPADW